VIAEGLTLPEVLLGLRCWPDSQALLAGPVAEVLGTWTVGWHDTSVQPYRGAFAVVSDADPAVADLVGDVIEIRARNLVVYTYVLGRADVPHSVSLARRAFLGLSGLWRDDVSGTIKRVA
jgi:hypothetical protein